MGPATIIERLGGVRATADKLGLTRQAVTMWRVRGRLPPHHVPAVARALDVPPAEVWPELAGTPATQEAA